nr:10562_t:CDS:2 [Entrophospora candida]
MKSNVKNGNWCPWCSRVGHRTLGDARQVAHNRNGNILSTIEEAKQITYSKNGNCLSEKYVNFQVPLQWRCAKGHEWSTNLNHIKHNRWCPFCRNKYEDLCRKIITEYLRPPSKIQKPDFLKTS